MKQLENANAWCPYCDCAAAIKVSQPYRDYTWRIEFHCLHMDCEERGIVMLMEVKQ